MLHSSCPLSLISPVLLAMTASGHPHFGPLSHEGEEWERPLGSIDGSGEGVAGFPRNDLSVCRERE